MGEFQKEMKATEIETIFFYHSMFGIPHALHFYIFQQLHERNVILAELKNYT